MKMRATGVVSCGVLLLVILALVGGAAFGGWKLYEASPRAFVQAVSAITLIVCLYALWLGRDNQDRRRS